MCGLVADQLFILQTIGPAVRKDKTIKTFSNSPSEVMVKYVKHRNCATCENVRYRKDNMHEGPGQNALMKIIYKNEAPDPPRTQTRFSQAHQHVHNLSSGNPLFGK